MLPKTLHVTRAASALLLAAIVATHANAQTPAPRVFAPLVGNGRASSLPPPSADALWVAPNGQDTPANGAADAPLRSLAYACARAQSGATIRLTAGEFRETAQCALRPGVRVSGNGRAGAGRTIVYAPTAWDVSGKRIDDIANENAEFVVLIKDVADVTVDNIEFRGNARKARGALRVIGARAVTLREIAVVDFRFTGVSIGSTTAVDAQYMHIENSGFEWTPGQSALYPDGGSVGNLGIHNVSDAQFGHITIKTTNLHGYGIKAASLSRVRFHNLDIDVHPFQSWRGVSPNNFDMEIHGGHAELVEIAHSRFRQTLSLMGGNDERYDRVPYTIHLHHNLFDMKANGYGVELGTDKMVVDHNWFRGTWTALQNYGDASTRIRDLTVFNNVVENLSMRFVGLKGRAENLRMFGNTVYLGPGGGQSYLVTIGNNNASRNWLIANNAIVGSTANDVGSRQMTMSYDSATAPRDVRAHNNVYRDIAMAVSINGTPAPTATNNLQFFDNINVDPGVPTGGPDAYQPPASSPLVDRGQANVGIRTAFSGAGRDIGAFERGEPAWRAGLGTTSSEITYLWAPTTTIRQAAFVDVLDVDLNTPDSAAEIRYTLDGSEPGPSSTRYTAPIRVTQPVKIRARTFRAGFGSPTALALDLTQGVNGYPNLAANGVPSASSVYPERDPAGDYAYAPAKAFDGITYSWLGWTPASSDARPWLQVDLRTPSRIRYVSLFTRAQINHPDTRRNFEIRASNDPTFATYAVLASQGAAALPHEGVFEAEITNATPYRYVRVAKTVNEGFFVTELQVLGEAGN